MSDTRPSITVGEMDSQWEGVQRRLVNRRRGRRAVGAGAVVLAAAAASWFLVGQPSVSGDSAPQARSPVRLQGAPLQTGQDVTTELEGLELQLLDAKVAVQPRSRLQMTGRDASNTRVSLGRGSATFDVAPNPKRRFFVRAGRVEVEVIGTRFTVSHQQSSAPAVSVSVERGVVAVRDKERGREVRLEAGETWSTRIDVNEPSREEKGPPAPEVASAAPDPSSALPVPRPSASASREDQAKKLFAQANELRGSGSTAQAARTFERLVQRYPESPHAAFSALEAARLYERSGNARGAIRNYQVAANATRGESRQSALYGLVRLTRGATCSRWKRSYLDAYPNGRYAANVAEACGK